MEQDCGASDLILTPRGVHPILPRRGADLGPVWKQSEKGVGQPLAASLLPQD